MTSKPECLTAWGSYWSPRTERHTVHQEPRTVTCKTYVTCLSRRQGQANSRSPAEVISVWRRFQLGSKHSLLLNVSQCVHRGKVSARSGMHLCGGWECTFPFLWARLFCDCFSWHGQLSLQARISCCSVQPLCSLGSDNFQSAVSRMGNYVAHFFHCTGELSDYTSFIQHKHILFSKSILPIQWGPVVITGWKVSVVSKTHSHIWVWMWYILKYHNRSWCIMQFPSIINRLFYKWAFTGVPSGLWTLQGRKSHRKTFNNY